MSMQQQILDRLQGGLDLSHLEVINESSGHNVPAGSETHFKVVAVSAAFAGLSAVKRHQAVYALLREPLASGVHALALHTYTPGEWAQQGAAPGSPACHGGSRHDQH
jgi:stress-induced morphogen